MTPPHLLLVDDEPNIIKALQRLFFDEDYEVLSASSGEEALRILRQREVDLIIADYRMCGMNGIEFFRQARQIQPDAVRIILSGYAEIRVLTDAINEGNIYRFIFKPWNDDELRNTIQLALAQRDLVLENRNLAQELLRKNQQLEDFNRHLEQQVAQRTRELTFRNKVLSISQDILEFVPVGVIGFSDLGEVVLMNRIARQHFPVGIGKMLEEALPKELSGPCRSALVSPPATQSLAIQLHENVFQVEVHRLSSADVASGAVMLFSEVKSSEGVARALATDAGLLAEDVNSN